MGYHSHSVVSLGPPFLSVDEAVFVIPKNGTVKLDRSRFKILFILGGEIEHEVEGKSGRRPLRTGDILVVPAAVRHVYINEDHSHAVRMQTVRLFLHAEHLRVRAARRVRKPESDLSDYILHHFPAAAQICGGINNEINQYLTDLRRETEQRAIGFRHRVRSLCANLVVAVSRKLRNHGNGRGRVRDSAASQLVVSAKEYIFKHLGEDLTLGEIAWHAGKSEEHLARVFKQETGESVFDYVREMRVHKAKTHMMEPNLSLTEIAERCGFHSLSFFSRTFRQCTGTSPSEYRRTIETTLQV